jgi:hypothetical protein
MKLRTKKLLATLGMAAASLLPMTPAQAQVTLIDPVYLLSTGYCNVYQAYLTNNYIFGREIGCSPSNGGGSIIGGYFHSSSTKVSFTIPSSSGGQAILVFDLATMDRERRFVSADGLTLQAPSSNPFTIQFSKPSGTYLSELPNELLQRK